MTTSNNSVNVPLTGNTGTGNFVGSTSPTLITPTLGVATATSIAFSPTTGGIVGTTTNDNASAGYVGELKSSTIAYASRVNMTTSASPQNLFTLSLTAGDWDVWGYVGWYPSGTTVFSYGIAGIYTSSGTLGDAAYYCTVLPSAASATCNSAPPMQRINVSSPTSVYLVGQASWTSGNVAYAGGLLARRVR